MYENIFERKKNRLSGFYAMIKIESKVFLKIKEEKQKMKKDKNVTMNCLNSQQN